MAKRRPPTEPIGETLRRQRVEVLGKGLREMAAILSIAPAHLTDIEKGRRTPSQELLLRISIHYKLPEAQLRAGWNRADTVLDEVGTENTMLASKAPALIRAARELQAEDWDRLIDQAQRLAKKATGEKRP